MGHSAFAIVLLLGSATMGLAQQATDDVAPEAATGSVVLEDGFGTLTDAARAALTAKADGKPVTGQDWMISAAHPLAVEAGLKVLRVRLHPPV